MLSPAALAETRTAMAAMLGDVERGIPASGTGPDYGWWSAPPHSIGVLAADRSLVVATTDDRGSVRPSHTGLFASERIVLVPENATVEVTNTSDEPINVMIAPITRDLAKTLDDYGSGTAASQLDKQG